MHIGPKGMTVSAKKIHGAEGEFAPETPKRAPEIVKKYDFGGDLKIRNGPKSPP